MMTKRPIIVAAIALFMTLPTYSIADSHWRILNFEEFRDDLKEPNIRETCTDATDQFRLLVFPIFSEHWSVRIERTGNNLSIHKAKSSRGNPVSRSSSSFDSSDWRSLSEVLIEVDFSNLTPASESDLWRPDDDWATFERCHNGKYSLVQRQRTDDETAKLFEYIDSLNNGD
jgi:hypothetical protein